jgi:Cu(I)/Ag(I) efflux system membrane protein CusA/SilA
VFEPDAAALARFGVDAELVRATAEVVVTGGELGAAATQPNGSSSLPRRVRVSLDAPWLPKRPHDLVRDATVRSGPDGKGQPVPLALLGSPRFVDAPAVLHSEKGELSAYVHVDVADGTDLTGYVDRARTDVEHALTTGDVRLGANERIEWTGQYTLIAAGERRLALIAPLVLLSMLGLLMLQFRSVAKSLIVLASVPFALVGSFWTLYLLDYRLSAPVWVGLLSVVGLAMQTGVLMVVYIDDAYERRVREGRMRSREDVIEAHAEGTVLRLRPKIMTISTMGACLLPLLWSDGAGSEIMRRVAAPMVGGLVTSAFLTLEVIPVLYTIWRVRQLETQRERVQVPSASAAE